jgi:hypothetical protein
VTTLCSPGHSVIGKINCQGVLADKKMAITNGSGLQEHPVATCNMPKRAHPPNNKSQCWYLTHHDYYSARRNYHQCKGR